jgi:acid phosphatase type 7
MHKKAVGVMISFGCGLLVLVYLKSQPMLAHASTARVFNGSSNDRATVFMPLLIVPINPTLRSSLTSTKTPTRTWTPTMKPSPTRTPTIKPSPTQTPTVRPSPTSTAVSSGAVIVVGAGDIACGGGSSDSSCKQKETSDLLLTINPDRVLALGDNQYETGSLSDFQNFYHPTWGRVKSKTSPVAGNHEYGTSTGNASGYFAYFGAAAGDPAKGYYSYNLGSWHLIALNSNCARAGGCSPGNPQYTWLQNDLEANSAACTLAYLHHPLWSSSSFATSIVKPLMQLLYDYGAELVLAGHAHSYERFARQDPNGNANATYGLREIVVGTGGRSFTRFSTVVANSQVRNAETFGVLKLTLASSQYTWQFVPIAGSTWSDGPLTELCHGPHP